MSLQEKSDLALTFAQVLRENGQSTDETLAAAERLSNILGLRTRIIPGWEEIQLETTDGTGKSVSLATAPSRRRRHRTRCLDHPRVKLGQLSPKMNLIALSIRQDGSRVAKAS